jgi:diguanylate cyclase (GGDEF)-like protein/PAS domain S-box-containing protein
MPIDDESDFQFLAEHSADILCRSGMDRVIRYVSPSCFHILGWTPEEMTGKGPADFILPEDFPALDAAASEILTAKNHTATATVRIRRKDGSAAWVEMNGRLVHDTVTGEPSEYVLVMRDITERKSEAEKLSVLAHTDGLTGLLNRRSFDRALKREWKRTLREDSQMALMFIDVDHFKELNDRYGHTAGDDCLRAVAAAISGAVRATDTVARYGGEELAVILPACDLMGAVNLAEKVRLAIKSLRLPNQGNPEGGGWVTVSVGVAAEQARRGRTLKMPESLLLAADNALYKAKHEGRNQVATAMLIAQKRN